MDAKLKSLRSDWERHEYVLRKYILNQPNKRQTDIDVIRDNHRFLWPEDEASGHSEDDDWKIRLARRYYDKLFKEYCIADLTRYKENKVALRWRVESEVVTGIGQFQCGSRKCPVKEDLSTWEVNFAYLERKKRQNALVKLRLCPEHSAQLNYTSQKREIKRQKRLRKYPDLRNTKHRKLSSEKETEGQEELPSVAMDKLKSSANAEGKESFPTLQQHAAETETERGDNVESEDIWNKKLDIDSEPISRETEFERYLEDLLL